LRWALFVRENARIGVAGEARRLERLRHIAKSRVILGFRCCSEGNVPLTTIPIVDIPQYRYAFVARCDLAILKDREDQLLYVLVGWDIRIMIWRTSGGIIEWQEFIGQFHSLEGWVHCVWDFDVLFNQC
jgi:hypothetical protein